MAIIVSNNEYQEIKTTLINCLASELRAALYQSLVNELGSQRTLCLLLAAEEKAKKAVVSLPYKSLTSY